MERETEEAKLTLTRIIQIHLTLSGQKDFILLPSDIENINYDIKIPSV